MNILKLMMFVASVFSYATLSAMKPDTSIERRIINLKIDRSDEVQSIHEPEVQNKRGYTFLKWREAHIQRLDRIDREIKRLEEELQEQCKSES